MGVDTKAILIGSPKPQEIAAALRAEFGGEVSVIDTNVEDMHIVTLADPKGRRPGDAELRSMAIHVGRFNDYPHVYSEPHTLCSLGAFGGSVTIMEALARWFGGFVLDADSNDYWRFIDRSHALVELPPLDRLRIEIEKIVGAKKAIPLVEIAHDRDAMGRIIDAYADHLGSTA